MTRFRKILALGACVAATVGACKAESPAAAPTELPVAEVQETVVDVAEPPLAPKEQPADGFEFSAFADSRQTGNRVLPQLRGAYLADYRDWPASLYATFLRTDGLRAACTAALIGPEVMLTAAHCVPPSGEVGFRYGATEYDTICTRHPQYVSGQDKSADYALCRLTDPFVAPSGGARFLYETVDITPVSTLLNKPIVLTGFGCTSDQPGGGPADGKYRFGMNLVVDTSMSKVGINHAKYYAGSEDNNIFTEHRPDVQVLANLCPGDSGGPAFRATSAQDIASRVLIGVNSRVFYRDSTMRDYGASLISAVGTPEFESWARGWVKQEDLQACGLSSPTTLTNCRQ